MTDTKVSALAAIADPLTITDVMYLARSGVSNKATLEQLMLFLGVYKKTLTADQSNSTVTPTKVTGLDVTLPIGTYNFDYYIRYQAAAATTGVRFDVNFTGATDFFLWDQYWNVGINANSSDAPDQDMIAALGGVISAFSSRGKGTAGRGTTLSVDTLAADMLMRISGCFKNTVAGNLELWHGSEVAAASTMKIGSQVRVFRSA